MKSRIGGQLGVTAAIFLVVVASALWLQREDVRLADQEDWSAALPDLSAASVQALVITHGDTQLLVERAGSTWSARGSSTPVDSAAVDDLVTAIAHLQVGPSLDVPPSEEFGLSPPRFQLLLQLSSREEVSIHLGSETPDGHHDYVYISETVRISRTPVSHIAAEIIASQSMNEGAP
jgi:hypothetical protein